MLIIFLVLAILLFLVKILFKILKSTVSLTWKIVTSGLFLVIAAAVVIYSNVLK